MAVGRDRKRQPAISPIVKALAWAESRSDAEVRVHLSRRFFEPDPRSRARDLFEHYGMSRAARKNAVLLYFNLRLRRFAVVAGPGVDAALGEPYWREFSGNLREDLRSTHFENAVAIGIRTLGVSLQGSYPVSSDSSPR